MLLFLPTIGWKPCSPGHLTPCFLLQELRKFAHLVNALHSVVCIFPDFVLRDFVCLFAIDFHDVTVLMLLRTLTVFWIALLFYPKSNQFITLLNKMGNEKNAEKKMNTSALFSFRHPPPPLSLLPTSGKSVESRTSA
jgi:hypothetical protein